MGTTYRGRFETSLDLVGRSLRLAFVDRTLLVLGLVGGLLSTAAAVAIFTPALASADWEWRSWQVGVALVLFSYPLTLLSVAFNVAATLAARAALEGRHCTVREAMAGAWARRRAIAVWSLLAAGVGVALDRLSAWLPGAGTAVSWVLGVAWALGTIFAVPLMALEDRRPREAAARSVQLVRERWGEGVVGLVSITACTVPLGVAACASAIAGVAAWESGGAVLAAVLLSLAVLVLCVDIVITRTATAIFEVALYRYAVTGDTTGPFEPAELTRGLERR